MMLKNTINSRKVDHELQRKVLKDAGNSKEVNLDLVHLTMMLKNTTNSRKVDHNLQRKNLKDTANSGKVDHNLQRKVLKDATNSGKVDHDLQRKVLKDAGNSREVNLDLVHLTMMLKNVTNSRKVGHNLQGKVLKDAANSGKVDHESPKKSPERWHQSKKSRSQSPKKSLYYHSGPKVSPQVAVNLSQQKSSLKTPDLPNGSTS